MRTERRMWIVKRIDQCFERAQLFRLSRDGAEHAGEACTCGFPIFLPVRVIGIVGTDEITELCCISQSFLRQVGHRGIGRTP